MEIVITIIIMSTVWTWIAYEIKTAPIEEEE